jgi:HPt (histidine-containing phosphotransfer) domain-containing protein
MIINDDQRAVQKILSRLPRAARRGLARQCFAPFISNATYKGDSKAIFHVDHANLGSAAYGIASALAAKTAMSLQTEPGSGERLMLRPKTVCYPSELFGIVKNVNDFNPQAVAIADGNSMYGFFKPEDLCECPFMTDATDWLMFADPNEVEILELAFLNGQQEPEMFVADNPAVGQMFVGDKVQYKIRHEYKPEPVDYRGAYKAVVAG